MYTTQVSSYMMLNIPLNGEVDMIRTCDLVFEVGLIPYKEQTQPKI